MASIVPAKVPVSLSVWVKNNVDFYEGSEGSGIEEGEEGWKETKSKRRGKKRETEIKGGGGRGNPLAHEGGRKKSTLVKKMEEEGIFTRRIFSACNSPDQLISLKIPPSPRDLRKSDWKSPYLKITLPLVSEPSATRGGVL